MTETISTLASTPQTLSSANVTITATGTVIANGKLGIFPVYNNGVASPTAIYGAVYAPASLGTVTIHNLGLVDANGAASHGPFDAGIVIGSTGTLFNTGTITGNSAIAIFGTSGGDYVSNTKLIKGSDGVGLYLAGNARISNSGIIAGYNFGASIEIRGTAFVSNTSTGTIASPGDDALQVDSTGTVLNAGLITGYGAGIDLHKGGFVSNTVSGTINGYHIGISLYNGGTIINAGHIINIGTGDSPVAYTFEAIYLGNNISVSNPGTIVNILSNSSTGTIIGADYGIDAAASPATITNAGLIVSTVKNFTFNNGEVSFNGYPDAINLLAGGTVTNLAGGTIAGDVGVFLQIGGSVLNSGSIGGLYYGVYAGKKAAGQYDSPGTFAAIVTNTSLGVIVGAGDNGVELAGGGSVQNAGTIAGSAAGIRLDNTGTVTNSGTVFAYETMNYRSDLYGGVRLSFGGAVNNSGLVKSNRDGIVAVYAAASIINTGSVIGYSAIIQLSNNYLGNPIVPSAGIYLREGGFISNSTTGLISGIDGIQIGNAKPPSTLNNAGRVIGVNYAIQSDSAGGTITNSGLILSEASNFTLSGNGTTLVGNAAGISLIDGGTINNQAGGSIIGYQGIFLGNTGFVSNAGLISASLTGSAIYLFDGGTVINTGSIHALQGAGIYGYQGFLTATNTGTIIGAAGAVFLGQATFTDSGTITGTAGDAVSFAPGFSNRLIIQPGASFSGIVDGGNTIGAATASVLEFASAAAATTFSAAALNTQFIDFATITIDAGARVNFTGATTLAAGQTLADFGTITFTGAVTNNGLIIADPATIIYDSAVTGNGTIDVNAGDTIIFNGSVSSAETIDFLSPLGTIVINDPSQFNATTIGTGTEVFACFAAGTRILTPRGEVPVEKLIPGDIVITTDGDDVPIKWIGHRTIDLTTTRQPEKAQPVRIDAHSFAENLPSRDLFLSPDHALYFEKHLIPAKALINNRNVTQLQKTRITYYHIELAAHAAIFAENTPCETYLETGNRGCFENAGPLINLHPDFNPDDFQAMREAESFAPFCESGPAVTSLRIKLLDNAFNNPKRRRA